jgi:hypothetical protein
MSPVSTPSGRPIVDLSFGLVLSGTFRPEDGKAAGKLAAPPPAVSGDGALGDAAPGAAPPDASVSTAGGGAGDGSNGDDVVLYPPFPEQPGDYPTNPNALVTGSTVAGRSADPSANHRRTDDRRLGDARPEVKRVSLRSMIVLMLFGALLIFVFITEFNDRPARPKPGQAATSGVSPFFTGVGGFLLSCGVLWWRVRYGRKPPAADDWQFVIQDEYYYLFNDLVLHQTEWNEVTGVISEEMIVLVHEGRLQAIPRRFCRDTATWKMLISRLRTRIECKEVPDLPNYGGGGPYVLHDFLRRWTPEATEAPLVAAATGKMSLADAMHIRGIGYSWRKFVPTIAALAASAGLTWLIPSPAWQGFFAGVSLFLALYLWLLKRGRTNLKKQHEEWETKYAPMVAVRTTGIELHGNRGRSIFRWETLRRVSEGDGLGPAEAIGLYIEGAHSIIILARRLFVMNEWQAVLGYVGKLPVQQGRF